MKIFKSIILLTLIVSFTNCKQESRKKYKLTSEETLAAYISKEDVLTKEKLANILLCDKATSYQLVDLRTPHDFIINHIPGAINIPGKNILDEEYFPLLNQEEKILVLYCKGSSEVTGAYLILKQLGFKNIKIVLGGFDYINDYIINSYGIKTGAYEDEKPKYDFIRMIASTDIPRIDSIIRPTVIDKNPNKVIKDFDEECPDLN